MKDSKLSDTPATPSALPSPTLHIDFYLDLICPWCWIGLRNLRSACARLQEQYPELVLETVWHAQPLLPQIPAQGVPYQAFYEARHGGKQAVQARRAQIHSVAASIGLVLNFENIQVFPNSTPACSLVNAAQETLTPQAMYQLVDSLYDAYFSQGKNIGSSETLKALALAHGFDWDPASPATLDPSKEVEYAGGVPHLTFNKRWPTTGAVPASQLLHAMQQAVTEQLAATPQTVG